MEAEGSTGSENSTNGSVGTTNEGGGAYASYGGDPEVLKSLGLAHLLVLFWTKDRVTKSDEAGHGYCELRIDLEKYEIIGCDEGEETRQLLLYRDFAASTPIRSYFYRDETPEREGVIGRVYRKSRPEMSPNIRYYSEDEYPHQVFALSCGIRSSFCFPFSGWFNHGFKLGVMEIVSTRNQDVGALRKLCESFQGLQWYIAFRDLSDIQNYEIPKMDHLLKVVCQELRLPLTQYQTWDAEDARFTLVNQFSYSDFESLEPWCQLKDACFHIQSGYDEGPLGTSWSKEAFFCKDVTALSITEYPLAHYARNCRSFSCFIIYLDYTSPLEKKYALLFFLPAQEMDNFYLPSLLNSIWELIKEYLPNWKLASGEQLGQVLSVKVISSFNQHHNSLPHREGFRYTDLFENGTTQRIPIEASQPGKSKKCWEIKGNTLAAEGVDNFVEVPSDEVVKYDVIPASKRLKKSKIPFTAENIRMHFGRPQKDAAESFGVSLSTFKRRCRALNIEWWEPGKSKRISSEPGGERNSSGMSNLPIRLVTHASQEINTMTVKVTCNNDNIRFELPSSSGIAELNNSVIERLPLDGKSFSLKYQDDEGDWIVIACDKDVQECIKISRLLKKTTIKMLLGPLISNYAL